MVNPNKSRFSSDSKKKTPFSFCNMGDRLVEIQIEDVHKLRDIYAPDASVDKSYIALMTLETYIRWFKEHSDIKNVHFYCLNGDYSDGTFVVTVSKIKKMLSICIKQIFNILFYLNKR